MNRNSTLIPIFCLIQISHNPFTSDFTINYQTTEQGRITIKHYNMNGQQMLARNVTVTNSFNIITITEAAQLTKGMYVAQFTRDNNLVSAEKIIMQ